MNLCVANCLFLWKISNSPDIGVARSRHRGFYIVKCSASVDAKSRAARDLNQIAT